MVASSVADDQLQTSSDVEAAVEVELTAKPTQVLNRKWLLGMTWSASPTPSYIKTIHVAVRRSLMVGPQVEL